MGRLVMIAIIWLSLTANSICAFSFSDMTSFFGVFDDSNTDDQKKSDADSATLLRQFIQYNKNNGILGDAETNPEAESQFISKMDKDGNGMITSLELSKVTMCYIGCMLNMS